MNKVGIKAVIYCGITILFLALLTIILLNVNSGKLNPHSITTPEPVSIPKTDGIMLNGYDSFDTQKLTDTSNNKPILLSFFASWCVPCVEEMSALKVLSKDLEIWGVAYQDKAERAINFINRDGSPFRRSILDEDGHVGIEWHVTGVPENFLIYHGKVVWHEVGSLSTEKILAVLKKVQE